VKVSMSRGRRDHLTFKGNLRQTRYGWLRLTPAYSVHQVHQLLNPTETGTAVLDPFCGTGTTALVCAEQGIACDTVDINPFLVWLAGVKTRSYRPADVESFVAASTHVREAIRSGHGQPAWLPPLHQIEKWWDGLTLAALGHAFAKIEDLMNSISGNAVDLLKVAFCRTLIQHAHVTFGHQSMSFKKRLQPSHRELLLPGFDDNPLSASWQQAASEIASAAMSPIRKEPRVELLDARNLAGPLRGESYGRVITSPPYPNRMSYIRELRPYMYWLRFLNDGRAAGELDWLAIGGTWGCATSNLSQWRSDAASEFPFPAFPAILKAIAAKSEVLSKYVHKYFVDMLQHCRGLFAVVKPGGTVHYIVGNSKFYDVLLPVEKLYAAMFENVGFVSVRTDISRKRTSKKELFEFVVSAAKPGKKQTHARPTAACSRGRP